MTVLECKNFYAVVFGSTDIESLVREFWASSGVTSAVQEKCNFSKDHRGIPEDGPYGLKRVGASIQMF
jgi:hypothetical protein